MTVELVTTSGVKGQGPFVWPEEPSNYQPWAKEQFAKAREEQEKKGERRQEVQRGVAWPENMEVLGNRARRLLRRAGRL